MATKKEIFLFASILLLMLGFLVYGFFAYDLGSTGDCWSQFKTENEAIMNCEGEK